jgi:tetratricopeptide (TPR) repeat protein
MAELGFPRAFLERTREVVEKCSITSKDLAAASSTTCGPVVLGTREAMGGEAARRDAAAVLGGDGPEAEAVAARLEGIPRRSGIDASTAVVPGPAPIPLKRVGDLLVTQWAREDVEAAGARLAPIDDFPDLAGRVATEVRYQEGLDAFRRRRHKEARSAFEDVLGRDAGHANARYQLALVHFYGRAYKRALEVLERLAADRPDFERLPHLLSHVGWCRVHLGDSAGALAAFRESVRLRDRVPGSHLGIGLAAHALGRFDEAVPALRRFLEMAPDHARAAQARGILEALGAAAPTG